MASTMAEPELTDETRRAKKKSSRRHHRDDESAGTTERRSSSRRKKSSDGGVESPSVDAEKGERKKKSKKHHTNREDETPEEREERRRRRREKKQAKEAAAAAAAAAAAVDIPSIDDVPDDRLPRRVIENPPVPLSDSEHEDVVEIVERHVVTQPQPPPPPKPATKPKPPPPALKPKPPKPGGSQQPPPQQQQQPPPPPARRDLSDQDEADNGESSGDDYRGGMQQPLKRWDVAEDMRYPAEQQGLRRQPDNYDDDVDDDVPDEAAAAPPRGNNSLNRWNQQQPQPQPQQSYGRRAVPPPQPQQPVAEPDAADPMSLHRYLADTLEDSDDERQQPQQHQQQQQQQQEPDEAARNDYRYYQDRYDQQQQQYPGDHQQYPDDQHQQQYPDDQHQQQYPYDQQQQQYPGEHQQYPDDPQQQQYAADLEQRFSEMVEADMSPPEPPPIPEGRKGGGGLLGRLFSSFRSSKRKNSHRQQQQQPRPQQLQQQPQVPSESGEEQPGLAEQGKWRSNPSMFNANENATPGNTLDPRMPPAAMMQQQQQQQRLMQAGIRTVPDTEVHVILLDGEEIGVPLPRKATGAELMARVCEHIDVQETDYFGLTYVDAKERMWFWLDSEKKVLKQLKHCDNRLLNFQVKFYPPEPNMLFADVTRYQLCLQVRQDIYTGKLPCTWVTQALLGSFQVQSELGDYDLAEHGEVDSIDYLQNFEFVHNQTTELVRKIAELHRGHKGVTPEVADLRYLETARRLEFYGVDLHPARDLDDVDITIGVCFGGVLVYKDRMRISRFAWPKILRISYRKNLFYLKIRSDLYDNVEAVVGFKMMNHKWAKRLWKIAIENHSFFRLKEAQLEKSGSRSSLNFIRGNSSHRFSGRTMHQYRTESGTLRHSGTFDRSLTKRMSASLPSLKGSQYGSFHSLNRLHPRDMRPQASGGGAGRGSRGPGIGGSSRGVATSSGGGGGGGGGQPVMMMARTGSVSILPTSAFNRPSSRAQSTTSDDLL